MRYTMVYVLTHNEHTIQNMSDARWKPRKMNKNERTKKAH